MAYFVGVFIGYLCEAIWGAEWELAGMAWATSAAPVVYWLFVARGKKLSLRAVMGRGVRGRQLSGLLLAATACFGVMLGWLSVLRQLAPSPELDASIPSAALPSVLVALGAVTVGPVREELGFRGILFPVIARRLGATWAAVVSSALFGLLHSDQLGSALFGFVMVGLYLRTRSLWAPLLTHAAYNAISILVLGLFQEIVTLTWVIVALQVVCLPWLVRFVWRTFQDLRALDTARHGSEATAPQ